tara:strand:+ start:11517 stop:13502 length:1986 start_codon:yes stop_codon:yes gene_type:complete
MGAAMKYIRVTENGFSKARLIPEDSNLFKLIKSDRDIPWFYSTFRYNEEHKKHFEETKSVAGIRDVTANMVWWDFDAKNVEDAKVDTITLVDRLLSDGFPTDTIKVNYSGNKGFHVVIKVDHELVPDQVQNIATKYAGDLKGFDTSLYDANQVLRIPLSKHEKSNVYCSPITLDDLRDKSAIELKEMAKTSPKEFNEAVYLNYYKVAELSDDLLAYETPPIKKTQQELTFDLSCLDGLKKPPYLDEARWYLMNGFFRGSETADIGERNHAFLCLAATFKNQGFSEQVITGLLGGVSVLQSQRTGETEFNEFDINVITKQVFSDTWKGGMFSAKDPRSWLNTYAISMGIDVNKNDGSEMEVIKMGDVKDQFIHFVKNIKDNTIVTGIDSLDKVMPMTIGSNIGLVGAAGSGKTAIALKVLNNTSKAGVVSVFASLDMTRTRIFEKLAYRVTGDSRADLYDKIINDKAGPIFDKIDKEYGNVFFYDRSSPSVEDIRKYILKVEKDTGQKVKFLMLDYFERVSSGMSDETASSKKVAGDLQDLLNDLDIAIITMCQPNKMSLGGGPDTELKSYTAIKGSSFLYQSFRGIMSISRPFYTPDLKEHDHYMIVNILKNDLGELDRLSYGWNGKRGEIRELEDIEHQELRDLLKMKEAIKEGKDDGWG